MSAPLTAPYTDAAATKAYYQSLYDGLVTASDPMAGLALFSRACKLLFYKTPCLLAHSQLFIINILL